MIGDLRIIDADGHAEEWAETFSEKYLEGFEGRRPQIIGSGNRAFWLIDSQVVPHPTGRACMMVGTPTGYGEVPTAFTARKVDAAEVESMELRRPEARLQAMDAENLDLQVLYPTLFLAYPLTTDPALGSALCRAYNSWLGDVCRQTDRLKFVALVDLDDPEAAAAEVGRARGLGAVGVMVLGTAGDRLLDHPALEPFYAECSQQNMPISVHVGWSSPALNNLYDQLMPSFVIPFTVPLLMGFVSMLSSGVLERYPNLKVGFFEGGCMWLHFLIDRVDHRWTYVHDLARRMPGVAAPGAQRKPSEVLRSGQVYITAEVEDPLLPQVLDLIGEEHMLFGSDMPHGDREPFAARDLLAREDITDSAKRKILYDNPRRFYNL